MTSSNRCPDRSDLEAYTVGKLPAEAREAVADHVDSCADCQSALDTMPEVDDTIVTALRADATLETYDREPAFRDVLARIEQLISSDAAAPPDLPSEAGGEHSSARAESEQAELGSIRDYRLLAKLGEGGMGTVYRAIHGKLEKTVAIKVIRPDRVKDKQVAARFSREMKAIGKLDHPNVVLATDAGETDDTHFLVMEYVDGVDLANLARRPGRISIPDACELIRQAANGLQYAHEREIVHRDVKPSNLMLARDGRVKVLDLGLALLNDPGQVASQLTGAGLIMGTLDYMAPEQLDSSHEVDARADVYGLGATLYELLCGTPPLGDERYKSIAHKLSAVASAPIVPVTERRPKVPDQLERVLERVLAKKPSDRYGTARELSEALKPFAVGCDLAKLASSTETAVPDELDAAPEAPPGCDKQPDVLAEPSISRDSQSSQRRRLPWLIAVSAAFLLVCGIVVIIKFNGRVITIEITDEPAAGTPKPTVGAGRADRPPLAVAPFTRGEAEKHQRAWSNHLGVEVEVTNSIGMKLRLIPPGEFDMGSPDSDEWAKDDDEKPQHHVRITKPFYMGAHEVTVSQFREFVEATTYRTKAEHDGKETGWNADSGKWESHPDYPNDYYSWKNPGFERDDSHPVFSLTWTDANEFCRWLSEKEGAVYRLPTEAEWEYACRAGTTTLYACGNEPTKLVTMGNVQDLTFKDRFPSANAVPARDGYLFSAPVGMFQANSFGLFDMHGNVMEWCMDSYDPDLYKKVVNEETAIDPVSPPSDNDLACVARGPGFDYGNARQKNRSAERFEYHKTNTHGPGIRVVRELKDIVNAQAVAPKGGTPIEVVNEPTTDQPNPEGGSGDCPRLAVAPFTRQEAEKHQRAWADHLGLKENDTNSIGMESRLIPPGEFFMGSPDWDELAEDDEKPQHPVRITKSFYMGVYEVTVAQFREFVEATNYRTQREYDGKESGWNADAKTWEPHPDWPNDCYSWKNPGFERDESHPVFSLTWTDANEFCRWLSEKEGAVYRLPTDAEWEYACRAGTPTLYACGNDPMELVTMGNVYDLTFRDQFPGANVLFARDGYLHTAPVGKFEPNSFGLFDMHGNVSEWCLDSYDAEYYSKVGDETPAIDPKGPPSGDNVICVERGGHFLGGRPDIGCRSAHRMGRHRSQSTFGFRVVREL